MNFKNGLSKSWRKESKKVRSVISNIKKNWVLHHINAPCHTTISINKYSTSKHIFVAPQLPYSPDLTPCHFFSFPRLKNNLNEHHFGALENIKNVVTDQLKVIPVSKVLHRSEDWKNCLRLCVHFLKSDFERANIEF